MIFDEEAVNGLTEAGEFNIDERKCNLVSNLNIQVLTSSVGLIDNMQNYIVGVKVGAVKSEWTYDGPLD